MPEPALDTHPTHAPLDTPLTRHAGITVPLIGGPMYPCSNPELVAAVSEAGGIGIVQPVSLTRVYGYEFREGLAAIRALTQKPIGMNALIERTSRERHARMMQWVDEALEAGVRFFVTSLGDPREVVERAHAVGGVVYHDATERRWAEKAARGGVDGLIGVNRRAGGHAGPRDARALLDELAPLGLPVVCAGGVGTPKEFAEALAMGYAGVQLGTRLIATVECRASDAYKQALIAAGEDDVVLTERITGIPVAVLNTPYVQRVGLRVNALERWLLRHPRFRYGMRTWFALNALGRLERGMTSASGRSDYWQAGKSVSGIDAIEPAGDIVRRFAAAARAAV